MKDRPPVDAVHAAIGELQRLAELFGQRRQQLARGVGLTEQEWRVLEEIATEHFMPSMFARGREQTPAAVSRIVRHLLDKALITVSVSPRDGRQRRYVLSAKGNDTLRQLRADRRQAIDAVWMDLAPRELTSFTTFSRKLTERLESYARRRSRRAR
jgi:DNA-binding MarR family transcriptional regulator